MMNLVDLLRTLKDNQIQLTVSSGKLSYKAPKGSINNKIKASLKAHKSTLIQILDDDVSDISGIDYKSVALTTAQKQIWLAYQTLPDKQATEQYHVCLGFDVKGSVNPNRLKQAIIRTCAKYDSLNIRISMEKTGLTQGYFPTEPDIEHYYTNASELSKTTQAFVSRKFDVLKGALQRIAFFKTDAEHFRMVWCIHHIICDGYSLSLISQTLMNEYRGYQDNSDYKQLDFLKQAYLEANNNPEDAIAIWKDSLSNIEPEFWMKQADASACDHSTLQTKHSHSELLHSVDITLNTEETIQIDHLAHSLNISTFEYLLVIYCLTLYQISNQESFCITIPEAGRNARNVNTVGLFASARILAIQLKFGSTFKETIENIVAQIRFCLQLPNIPFEYLISQITGSNQASKERGDYQNIGFSYFHDTTGTLTTEPISIDDTQFVPLSFNRTDHRKVISLLVHRSGDCTKFQWHFRAGSLSERIARHNAGLHRALALSKNIDFNFPSKSVLPQPEWRKTLYRLIESQRSKEPKLHLRNKDTLGIRWLYGEHQDKNVAVRFSNSSEVLTYQALKTLVNQIAKYLSQCGIRAGDRVYLDVERSKLSISSTLAIWTIGAVYCPLNSSLPQLQKSRIVRDNTVITTNQHLWNSPEAKVIDANEMFLSATLSSESNESNGLTDIEHHWQSEDPFYHLHTSGSTGEAKAVEVTFNNILHYLAGAVNLYEINCAKHVLHHTELSFDVSMVEILIGFYSGGSIMIHCDGLMDAAQFSHLLVKHKLDTISLTASHWQRLVESPDFVLDEHPRQFKVGAEPLPAATTNKWLDRFGLSQELFNVYGPTETTVGITGKRITSTKGMTHQGQVTIGQNFLGYTLVCDPYGKPLPPESQGELYILGDTVSNGYYQNPERTQESFFHLVIDEKLIRGYKSGDLVLQRRDGLFFILGRKDHQIKWRGYRIELNAIELCLQQHPAVERCVLVPRRNTQGHVENLCAVIVPVANRVKSENNLSAPSNQMIKELNSHLQSAMPAYTLPSHYYYADKLPLKVNRKLDRQKLDNWLNTTNHHINRTQQEAIESETECIVVEIWKTLLKQDSLDLDKNFFDQGGHSLLLLDMLRELNQAFAVEFSLLDLLELTTVRAIAAYIDKNQDLNNE